MGRGNWRKAVQRHKPPVIRYADSRYNMIKIPLLYLITES